MKKLMFIILLGFCIVLLFAQTEEWLWAKRAGGTYLDFGQSISIDAEGNSYVTGNFQDTASFGSTTLTSSGGWDVFVAKMDTSGNWLWAKQAGGTDNDSGRGIFTDANGISYVTGFFQSTTASFGSTTLSCSGFADVFVSKLDNNGNWLWAKKAGGTSSDIGSGIATDTIGNIYVTGGFSGTTSFGSSSLTSIGDADVFVAKIDANGNWLWVKQAGGTGPVYGYGISTDASVNIYVTGDFSGTTSFGSSSLNSSGNYDIFVAKLDPNGNWLWAQQAGGEGSDGSNGIVTDDNCNSFVTGSFLDTASFGSTSLISSGGKDVFVGKLDNNGNWLWAKKAGGASDDYGYEISSDASDNCYVTGNFYGNASFGSTSLTSNGNTDVFVAKLDTNGNWLGTKKAGGMGQDGCYGIATDAYGNSYVTGYFRGTATFGTTSLTSSGSDDIFIAKIGPIEPSAIFSVDVYSGLQPLSVQFTDQSTPGTGSITTWFWEFGNGDTSALQHPLYVYEEPGVYSVTLTVINSLGLSNSVTYIDYITVMPRFPLIGTNPENRLDFGTVYLGWASEPQPLWIKNPGTASLEVDALSYYLANGPFAVQEGQLPYSIAAGDSLSIHLVFTPQVIGTVVDSLYIHNNSANLPICGLELRGSGEYVPPLPPENVAVVMDGYNAVITWDAVTQTIYNTPFTPDGYLVFFDGLPDPEAPYYFLAMTPGLTYTHLHVGEFAEYMFYRVIAYRNYGRNGFDINSLNLVPGMPEAEVMKLLP